MIAPNPTAFGVQMPNYGLPVPPPQAPVQTGLDLTMFGGPGGSGAGRGVPMPAPQPTTAAPRPTANPAYAAAAPAFAGLQAGQMGTQAHDTKTGIASAIGAAATGAATGAVVGGPVGAAVGGGVGLVTGALNAWMTVGKENKANRERRKLLAEAKAEQNRRDKIARDDALDGLAFQRRELADAKRLEDWNRSRAIIEDARAKTKARQEEFIGRGYVT